ncbi:MAG: hypothetical protein ACI4J5_05230 [Oscillospiraceae bacterium]
MKKLSFAVTVILFVMLLRPSAAAAFSKEEPRYGYDIRLECLADSEAAEELNQYRDVLLEYMNSEIKKQGKAAGVDTYSCLTEDDLDFTDDTKIHGIKKHGSYTDYEYNADNESFSASLGDEEYWYIVFQKEKTIYSAWLCQTDMQNAIGHCFADNWYIRQFYADLTERIGYVYLKYDTDVLSANINKLLGEKNESGKDIKVIFTDMGHINTDCAVIFVDGTAKYLYYDSFTVPYELMREDTPRDIRDSIQRQSERIFRNFAEQQSTEVVTLYPYNMVMYLLNTCERYM